MSFDLEQALSQFPLPKGVEDRVVNRIICAKALNVSENMITRYLDQGMPCIAQGSNGQSYEFQLSECFAWKRWREDQVRTQREDNERAAAQLSLLFRGQDPDAADDHVLSAKEIMEESRADYERNKAAELRGELVRAHKVRDLFEDILTEVRTQIVSLVDFSEMEFTLTPDQVRTMQMRCDGTLAQMRQRFSTTLPGEAVHLKPHVGMVEAAKKAEDG